MPLLCEQCGLRGGVLSGTALLAEQWHTLGLGLSGGRQDPGAHSGQPEIHDLPKPICGGVIRPYPGIGRRGDL